MHILQLDKIHRYSGLNEFRVGHALNSHIDLLTSIEQRDLWLLTKKTILNALIEINISIKTPYGFCCTVELSWSNPIPKPLILNHNWLNILKRFETYFYWI